MLNVYEYNGLPFFSEREVHFREYAQQFLADCVKDILTDINPAWSFKRIEGPTLLPSELLSNEYSEDDVFMMDDLCLRPETTKSTYAFVENTIRNRSCPKPPFVVWQSGKSYRREQDQPSKHCRFKEFYQQEFQCFYTEDTKCDYQTLVADKLSEQVGQLLKIPTRVVESNRLPKYSLNTLDIEVKNPDKYMEVCSISVRNDFDKQFRFSATKESKLLVLEIAFGLDRLIYNNFIGDL